MHQPSSIISKYEPNGYIRHILRHAVKMPHKTKANPPTRAIAQTLRLAAWPVSQLIDETSAIPNTGTLNKAKPIFAATTSRVGRTAASVTNTKQPQIGQSANTIIPTPTASLQIKSL